ncbi:MAG: sugar phosphate isomerase/epimerase [Candidatus Omnitrophota bacterium]
MNRIRIANAPCSWGVLEFNLEGEAAGFARVLDEMAQSGYEGTELGDWGFMPTDPAILHRELERRNLEMLGAFVPAALIDPAAHAAGLELALKTAKLLSAVAEAPFLVLADNNGTVERRTKKAGRIRPEDGMTDEQWTVFTQGAELIAREIFDETGVRTVFHHHCAGYVETPQEINRFLNMTDSELIGLCFDAGHYTYGGGDAAAGMKAYGNRIWHVHFKDCHPEVAEQARQEGWDYFAAVKNGVFCELGKGKVDFVSIARQLLKWNYEGWIVVEQDVLPGMGTPLESARRNREYIKSLGL